MVLNLPYTANRMEYAKFICEVFWTSFFGGKMDMSDTEDEVSIYTNIWIYYSQI